MRKLRMLVGSVLAVLVLSGSFIGASAAPAAITVEWTCEAGITITSSKAISNLILRIDGEDVKIFEAEPDAPEILEYVIDPADHEGELSDVFVKSGSNGARGVGERFALEEPVCGPVLGTGDVQITLQWDTEDDLDLHVVGPSGCHLSYMSRSCADGGQLDHDANVFTCGGPVDGGVENVFWPAGEAPTGTYQVYVHEFNTCTDVSPTFRLIVRIDGVIAHDITTSGSTAPGGTAPLLEFTY